MPKKLQKLKKGPGNPISQDEKLMIMEGLKPYLMLGYPLNKACGLAGYNPSTVNGLCNRNPHMKDTFIAWQDTVGVKARSNISSSISRGNRDDSKWWLERKERSDFSPKEGGEGIRNVVFILPPEILKKNEIKHVKSVPVTQSPEPDSECGGEV